MLDYVDFVIGIIDGSNKNNEENAWAITGLAETVGLRLATQGIANLVTHDPMRNNTGAAPDTLFELRLRITLTDPTIVNLTFLRNGVLINSEPSINETRLEISYSAAAQVVILFLVESVAHALTLHHITGVGYYQDILEMLLDLTKAITRFSEER